MAGAEVENPARPAPPGGAGAEHFAAGEPADEDQLVRRRDAEGLAVHLLGRDLEARTDALGDGVGRVDDPKALLVGGLAPGERAGVAHEGLEDLRVVAAVEDDEAHALEYAGADLGDDGVGDVAMGDVAPPREHVGLFEHGVGETMLRLVEGGGAHHEIGVFAEGVGDGLVHALGVDGGDLWIFFLVAIFAPDGDAHDGFGGEHGDGGDGMCREK